MTSSSIRERVCAVRADNFHSLILLLVGALLSSPIGQAQPEAAPLSLDFEAFRFELNSTPMPFADWAMVEAGNLDWIAGDGRKLPLEGPHGLNSPAEARAVPFALAHGVRIRAQAAEKTGTFADLVPAEHPWERGKMKAQTLLFDSQSQLYRVWYDCAGGLAYAESADLKVWVKPLLNRNAFEGSPQTNLVYIVNQDECLASGMFQKPDTLQVAQAGSIFVDPSAPGEERFKTTVLASANPELLQAFAKARGKALSSRVSLTSGNVLFPAVSADGIAWRVIPEPNLLHDADTQTVIHFDERIQRYVLYTRLWEFGRRVIARSETADFRDFPLPATVLAPGAVEPPYVDYYANAMTAYPSRNDLFLMFVMAYDRSSESGEVRAATSRDGKLWQFSPGNPIVKPGPPSAWDSHWPIAVPPFVRTPEDGMLLLYTAYNLPHKFPRAGLVEGNQGIARWPADRVFALEAPEAGAFCTPYLKLRGSKLLLNFQTERAGVVRVELRDREFKVIPGHSFAECEPLSGDDLAREVCWNGTSDLEKLRDEFVYLNFEMRAAKLFAMRAGE